MQNYLFIGSKLKVTFLNFTFIALLVFSSLCHGLTFSEVQHFLSRTGFSPTFSEVEEYFSLTRKQAVEKRLKELNAEPQQNIPQSIFQIKRPNDLRTLSFEERRAFHKQRKNEMNNLRIWWISEMLNTSSPFTENLTLFWHNHFVSSAQKVKSPISMAKQNLTLRRHSSGNFSDFLNAMIRDPALLQYLDNNLNNKESPNENLAREIMELFTLGEGHYTEKDIEQAAKALTGYSYRKDQFHFKEKKHDTSVKILFNHQGRWNGEDLVRLLLQQPQTAKYITLKLWKNFISEPPSEAVLNNISESFYKTYELKPLIRKILLRPEFWAKDNYGKKIKSPVKLVIGLYRQFGIAPKKIQQLIQISRVMGQYLLNPPNVKGWVEGEDWINTTTLTARHDFIAKTLRGMEIKQEINRYNKNKEDWIQLLVSFPFHSDLQNECDTQWKCVKASLGSLYYQLE